MKTTSPAVPSDLPAWQQSAFRLAMFVFRLGFGLLFLANGLAKLPGLKNINYIPFPGFLITYDGARNSLTADTSSHPIGLYKDIVDNVILAHYAPFGVGLDATEIGIGLMLVFGVSASLGAFVGFLSLFHIWFANWGRYGDRSLWAWEGPVEWIPLLALAFLASGRYYGLDAWVAARLPSRLRRWPFTG